MGKMIGRNQPCPCGSGRKYKHCCWNRERAAHAHTTPAELSQRHRLVETDLDRLSNRVVASSLKAASMKPTPPASSYGRAIPKSTIGSCAKRSSAKRAAK